jgi:hypothetical protein
MRQIEDQVASERAFAFGFLSFTRQPSFRGTIRAPKIKDEPGLARLILLSRQID